MLRAGGSRSVSAAGCWAAPAGARRRGLAAISASASTANAAARGRRRRRSRRGLRVRTTVRRRGDHAEDDQGDRCALLMAVRGALMPVRAGSHRECGSRRTGRVRPAARSCLDQVDAAGPQRGGGARVLDPRGDHASAARGRPAQFRRSLQTASSCYRIACQTAKSTGRWRSSSLPRSASIRRSPRRRQAASGPGRTPFPARHRRIVHAAPAPAGRRGRDAGQCWRSQSMQPVSRTLAKLAGEQAQAVTVMQALADRADAFAEHQRSTSAINPARSAAVPVRSPHTCDGRRPAGAAGLNCSLPQRSFRSAGRRHGTRGFQGLADRGDGGVAVGAAGRFMRGCRRVGRRASSIARSAASVMALASPAAAVNGQCRRRCRCAGFRRWR